MTDQYVLSIDPGVSTGIALGKYSETEPFSLVDAWQFSGGIVGLREWIDKYYYPGLDPNETESGLGVTSEWNFFGVHPSLIPGYNVRVVCEFFTPLQNKGFSLTVDAVEPKRCEGGLVMLGIMPDYPHETWQRPNTMYFLGGKTLPEKKKRARKFLKDTGNYRLPKQLGAPDNNDAVSATLHGFAWAMKHGSKASHEQVVEWLEKEGTP